MSKKRKAVPSPNSRFWANGISIPKPPTSSGWHRARFLSTMIPRAIRISLLTRVRRKSLSRAVVRTGRLKGAARSSILLCRGSTAAICCEAVLISTNPPPASYRSVNSGSSGGRDLVARSVPGTIEKSLVRRQSCRATNRVYSTSAPDAGGVLDGARQHWRNAKWQAKLVAKSTTGKPQPDVSADVSPFIFTGTDTRRRNWYRGLRKCSPITNCTSSIRCLTTIWMRGYLGAKPGYEREHPIWIRKPVALGDRSWAVGSRPLCLCREGRRQNMEPDSVRR